MQLVFCLPFLFGCALCSNAQITKNHVTSVTQQSHVSNASDALVPAGYATLESYGGILLGIGDYTGELELTYPAALPAGTTTYVKIDFDQDLLSALIGGNLGGELADVLGNLVLGNHYFNVEARLGAVTVLSDSSNSGFDDDNMRLIINDDGEYLLAITPNVSYDRIYIEDVTNALLLGVTNSMEVHEAYYFSGTGTCENAFATSFTGTGGTIDALGLGAAGVDDPEHVIDNDATNYSEISLGLLTVAGTVSQTVYFKDASLPTDQFHVKMQLNDPSLLNLGLADGIRIQALLDDQVVYTAGDLSLLNLDLLGLLQSGQVVDVPFTPNTSFDRVRITLSSLVQLNLTKQVRVYGVRKSPAAPEVTADDISICENDTASLTAQTDSANELHWFDAAVGGNLLATTAYNVGYTTAALSSDATFYVAATTIGCANYSERIPVEVHVYPEPSAPAVVESTVQVNSGGTATLEVQNPESHIDYRWYDASNNLVDTTPVLIINNVTVAQAYTVEAAIGTACVSPTATTVNVVLTTSILPPDVSPTDITITEGESAQINATTTDPNLDIVWYDQGGNEVFIGNQFNTPTTLIPGTYTYTVVTRDPVSLQESTPVTVTITVVPPTPGLDCDEANAQTIGTTAICILCGVDNPNQAVDGDENTYSRFIAPVSVTGSVWQELIFQQQGLAGDTVHVKVGTAGSLIDVDLISGLSFETYAGNTANNDGGVVDGNLIQLKLLSGGDEAIVTFEAGANFDRVRLTYQPLLGVLNSGWRIYGASIMFEPPVIVTPDEEICKGEVVSLEVTPATGVSINWYDSETSTTSLSTQNTYTTPVQTVPGEVTYYISQTRNGCENTHRIPITFTVLEAPLALDIDVAQSSDPVCEGSDVVLTPSIAPTSTLQNTPGIFNWYIDNNKTQAITDGAVINGKSYAINAAGELTVSGLTVADSPFSVFVSTIAENGCEHMAGELKEVMLTIVDTPTPTTSDTSQEFCIAENPTVADIQVNETNVTWYDAATGGTAYLTTDALQDATTYYGVLIDAVTGCESSVRLAVSITLNDAPTPTTNDTTQEFCSVTNPTVADLQVNETNITWYDALTAGTAYASTDLLQDGVTYYASFTDPTTGCESSVRLAVQVLFNNSLPPTTNDTTPSFCTAENATLADIQVNETDITWYDAANGGNVLPETTVLQDATTYYAAHTSPANSCESNGRLAILVTIEDAATPTTTDTSQEFCLANNPTIADLQVNESSVTWYDAATGGTAYAATDALQDATTYYASLTDATTGCESATRLTVSVTLLDVATPTTISQIQNFYSGDNPTVADIQVNETNVVWYDALTGGSIVAPGTPLQDGNTYFAVLVDATTGCESSVRLAIQVNIFPINPPSSTQTFCAVDMPTVDDLSTLDPNFEMIWYANATGGTPLADTTPLQHGVIYHAAYFDTSTNTESTNRYPVIVIVNDAATPTTSNNNQEFCAVDAPTVADIQVNEPNIVWYNAASNGNIILPGTALQNGSTYYASMIDPASGCESSVRLQVTVQINDTPTPTTTTNMQEFCEVDHPTIADIQVNETNVVWYASTTGTTMVSPSTMLQDGFTYYAVLVDATTGCESTTRLAVQVEIFDAATPTTNDSTQEFCAADQPTISDIQVNEANVIWYDAMLNGNILASSTALQDNETYYATLVDATNGCESSVRLAVQVNVNDAATPTTNNMVQSFCLADAPTVADIQVNEPNVTWYNALTNGNIVAMNTSLQNGATYYASITDLANGCESSVRLAVQVNVNDAATPTTNNMVQEFCAADTPTISDIQVNETNVVWYNSPTGGSMLGASTMLQDATTYYAALVDATTGCESSVRLAVQVEVNDAATPTTNSVMQSFCEIDSPLVSDIQVNETGVVWYSAPTGGSVLPAGTPLLNGITYYASLTDPASGCESSVRLAVTVNINDAATPTTNDVTQDFCAADNPTVANISVNEVGVTWYDAAMGGNVIASTTLLQDGMMYYGSLTHPTTGCESAIRLAIQVNVDDVATPTTTQTSQEFCASDNASVSDIQVNESNVVWYVQASGGTILPSNTPLQNGTTYYASLTNPATGCESSIRLAVNITLIDVATPTTNNTTQDFCASDNPVVSDLQVNETNIVFYDLPSGGTALSGNTSLQDGATYYASLIDAATGCESSVRLAITVNVNTASQPIINGPVDDVCVQDQITYTTEAGMSQYNWTVVGGTIVSGGGANDDFVTVIWDIIGQNTISVDYLNTNGCAMQNQTQLTVITISCYDLSIDKTVDNETPIIDENVVFTITVTNHSSASFNNIVVDENLPSGYEFVTYTASTGTYNDIVGEWTIPVLLGNETATLELTAKVLFEGEYLNQASITTSTPIDVDANNNLAEAEVEPMCLVVYNEFSPNGDGANETFRVDCITYYSNNTLEIYNRYGNMVYSTNNYQNDWRGIANNSSVGDDELPPGTYFYVIKLHDENKEMKGWVQLIR